MHTLMVDTGNPLPWSLMLLQRNKTDERINLRIKKALETLNIPFEEHVSSNEEDLRAQTNAISCQGQKKFLAAGQETALHAVMNGMLQDGLKVPVDHVLGYLPGTLSSDWIQTVGIPNNPEEAARHLKLGHYFFQDLGLAQFADGGLLRPAYFLNSASFGWFGAAAEQVAKKNAKQKQAKLSLEIRKQFQRYKEVTLVLTINGQRVFEGNCFGLSVHIGRYHGHGFLHAPEALPDDGCFEVCLIPSVGNWERFAGLKPFRHSGFFIEKGIKTWQAEQVEIETRGHFPAALDGYYSGSAPVKMDCLYQKLRIISLLRNQQL